MQSTTEPIRHPQPSDQQGQAQGQPDPQQPNIPHRNLASPDPCTSASLFAAGQLDDLLCRLLLPFWRQAKGELADALWVVRYTRRGEHLKLRLHADAGQRAELENLLRCHAKDYFDTCMEPDTDMQRLSRSDIPAIDPEDSLPGEATDRSLLWTTYRRSFINLGGEPFLSQDAYAGAMTQCLASSFEIILEAIDALAPEELSPPWRPTLAWRQKTLLKLILAGLRASGLQAEHNTAETPNVCSYISYHRDTLLRFYVPDLASEAKLRALFDQQINGLNLAPLRPLGHATPEPEIRQTSSFSRWRYALAHLQETLHPFRHDPEYLSHPFAADVSWPPLFKVFHGMANQIGLVPLQEAYVHHMLLAILKDAGKVEQ